MCGKSEILKRISLEWWLCGTYIILLEKAQAGYISLEGEVEEKKETAITEKKVVIFPIFLKYWGCCLNLDDWM